MSDPAIDRVLGRALTGVAYHNVPTVGYGVSPLLHVIDYGVELAFDGAHLSLLWRDGTYELGAVNMSLGDYFPSSERTDIASPPWDDLLGRRLVSARFGFGANPCERDEPWVVQLEFDPDAMIWIAAASYFEQGRMLVPCSSEIVVAWSPETARSFGLVVLQN